MFGRNRHRGGRARPANLADAVPLRSATDGQELILMGVSGGRHLQHRLAELGLTPRTRFRVVAGGSTGPLIISVRDSRLVLGHGMIDRIFVQPA